ncbi:hypothetical protein Acy02nite_91880 [Actinoplanes cyaneus]|uniref:Uncharacterized protein n=1 Tax=Actinoplanes cyaneus TaxID=52696 RepID=A0A919IU39_9ACTN|nr:hypothetical protein Acy02nite_91880 [Actinoplanes cyaneus]
MNCGVSQVAASGRAGAEGARAAAVGREAGAEQANSASAQIATATVLGINSKTSFTFAVGLGEHIRFERSRDRLYGRT